MTPNEVHVADGADGPEARPVGLWLKEADALIDAAFNASLEGTGVDRRGWQVLATLAKEPTGRSAMHTALASFDPPEVVSAVVDQMVERGWIEEFEELLRLTTAGSEHQQALRSRAEQVRGKVSAVLPQEEYTQLVTLLARLVEGLRSTPGGSLGMPGQ